MQKYLEQDVVAQPNDLIILMTCLDGGLLTIGEGTNLAIHDLIKNDRLVIDQADLNLSTNASPQSPT